MKNITLAVLILVTATVTLAQNNDIVKVNLPKEKALVHDKNIIC